MFMVIAGTRFKW